MKRYRKKPIEIEAVQWTGSNLEEIKSFVGESLQYDIVDAAWKVGKGVPCVHVVIKTLEGDHVCSEGDYIIKGIKGELYPCKPDIFAATYEDPSADVAPKSEVEQLRLENQILSQNADTAFQDGLNEAQDLYAEQIRSEVAREIFEAVDSMLDLVCAMTGLEITYFGKYAELKKKYTEERK